MKRHPFSINMRTSLEDECKEGFVSFSLVKETHGHPITVFLWHATGNGIKVQCVMHDLGPRREVGSLIFGSINSNCDGLNTIELPSDFNHDLTLEKLLFVDDESIVESGIAITTNSGKKLLLVSGACPHTVEISTATFNHDFEPEYPISDYKREINGVRLD